MLIVLGYVSRLVEVHVFNMINGKLKIGIFSLLCVIASLSIQLLVSKNFFENYRLDIVKEMATTPEKFDEVGKLSLIHI